MRQLLLLASLLSIAPAIATTHMTLDDLDKVSSQFACEQLKKLDEENKLVQSGGQLGTSVKVWNSWSPDMFYLAAVR